MSVDVLAVVLIALAAPPATLFPPCYAVIARGVWWRTPTGRALMTSTVALALLIDISLAYRAFGDNYALRDVVRLTVFGLIALGAWLKFGALLYEWHQGRRESKS